MHRLPHLLLCVTLLTASACRSSARLQVLDAGLQQLAARPTDTKTVVNVIITTTADSRATAEALQKQGIECTCITSSTLTARVPADRLKKVSRLPEIRRISQVRQHDPL